MMTKRFTVICLVMFTFIMLACCHTNIMAFREPNFAGIATNCVDVCNVTELISYRFLSGSCMQILEGKLVFFKEDNPDTDYYYNGQINSCSTYSMTIECPKGTFLRKIEWKEDSELKEGVKLRCSKPESTYLIPANNIFPNKNSIAAKEDKGRTCAAFKELPIKRDISKEADVDFLIGADCKPENVTEFDNILKCKNLSAISGMIFSIETETKYIKSSNVICNDVPNIAALCEVDDKKQRLQLSSESTKTIGVGLAPLSDLSEAEKNQLSFYSNFQLETEYTLLSNFKNNLGISRATGYDWRSAPKSTWEKEHTVTIQIETSPKCNTEIFEIVGRCSYMVIRPYFIERIDNCLGSSFNRIQKFPQNSHTKIYVSELPDSIRNNNLYE
ncbi:uncharacterized protein LOC119070181 [Bradysia coprophila]|uniref:uncharacterized protein LOC119070181 n=1 Tax=Bradysia coprophila TaxID=38358 RepID=UPI00187D8BE5|nr:uncharacterized protein LOC119070181 [Bradysia coprophila]